MRVPVFPQDIVASGGFDRLAFSVQKDWLGVKPISLDFSRELLARCLGYDDFHQVTNAASSPQDFSEAPPLGDVLAHSLATISSELLSSDHCGVYNLGELLIQVYAWPFVHLSVYREQYGNSDMSSIAKNIFSEQVALSAGGNPKPTKYELKLPEHSFTTKQLQGVVEDVSVDDTKT